MEYSGLERRDFLKAFTLLAGGSLIAANPWMGKLNAQDSVTGSKVKLGIIGTGSRGSLLAQHLLSIPHAEIIAHCDDYPPNLEKAGQLIGNGSRAFKDYLELLEMDGVQGVVVATPPHEHARISIAAMRKGKHVFCEKAMSIIPEECLEMVLAQKETGRILQIGFQRMFNIRILKGMEMIRAGKLGDITQIRACWHRNNDWRRPVPAPGLERKINWRLYREFSRGLMTELASHQLQVGNWIYGEIPAEVTGSGSINYWQDGREVFDNVNLVYRYPSGNHLIYDSMISNKKYGCEEQVMGPRGTLEMEAGLYFSEHPEPAPGIIQLINQIEHKIFDTIPVGGATWVPEDPNEDRGEYILDKLLKSDGTLLQMEAFTNAVRDDKIIPGLLEEAYYGSVAALLGDMAMMERRPVSWPDELLLQ
jgi:predicted dehydrogenase